MKIKNILYKVLIPFEIFLFYTLVTQNNLFKFESPSLCIKYFDLYIGGILLYLICKRFMSLKNNKDSLFKSRLSKVLFILLNLIISFAAVGKGTFLSSYEAALVYKNEYLLRYVLVNILVYPILYVIYEFIVNFKLNLDKNDRKKNEKKKAFITLFLVVFISWIIIAIGHFPGNITSDSSDMWAQALGKSQIGLHHSAFYAIIMRILSYIWKNPFIVIIFNIAFFSLVISHILSYFYNKKVKLKNLVIAELIFVFGINNVSLITMLWKDVPFTISLLWLSFEVYKLFDQKNFKYDKLHKYLPLIISMVFVYFFRLNGMIPYILTLLLLFICAIKFKSIQYVIVIAITIALTVIIKYPVFNAFDVSKNGPDTSLNAMDRIYIRGLAAMIYYDYSDKDKFEEFDKVISRSILVSYYNPYSNDTFDFEPAYINAEKNFDILKDVYFKYFFNHFGAVLRNQLDGTNLLWSYTTPSDGFNYTYDLGVYYYKEKLTKKELGISDNFKYSIYNGMYQRRDNPINSTVKAYRSTTGYSMFIESVFWRPAVALTVMLMVLISWIDRKKKLIISMVPTLANILFWCGFLYHQSYRYLWFIYVNTLLYILINIYENSIRKGKNK